MDALLTGFSAALTFENILYVAFGVTIGYIVGALPGLGKGVATAIAIPITFYISPLPALAFLIGISKGSAAGSAVSAILLNTPGEASSAPTAMDGYPLARQGKAKKALKMGLFASVIGDFCSTLFLIILAAPLAKYALLIGPVELTAILMFSLTFIAGLSGGSLLKGLIAGVIGLLLATVGLEIETAAVRFSFGFLELEDGLSIIPVAIGMLALAEMIVQAGNAHDTHVDESMLSGKGDRENHVVTLADWKACGIPLIRGTLVGSAVGILPGLGASVGSFLSYGMTKKAAKDPSRFGKGAIEGVAAAESADNAVVPSSLIPLFAIGIPGSVIAAILISAFVIQGVQPGPTMFIEKPDLIYGIYAAMLCASVLLLGIGFFGQNIFARVVEAPTNWVIAIVIFLCCLGAILQGGGIFGVILMIIFGIVGFLAKKLDFSFVTFLIGFVIGPSFELSMRQAIAIMDRDATNLINHPIALVFLAITVFAVWRISANRAKQNKGQTTQDIQQEENKAS